MQKTFTTETPLRNSPAPTDERSRWRTPSYAARRISRRYGITQHTAAEIAHAAGFPQFGEARQ